MVGVILNESKQSGVAIATATECIGFDQRRNHARILMHGCPIISLMPFPIGAKIEERRLGGTNQAQA
jgi:hypothetical protein